LSLIWPWLLLLAIVLLSRRPEQAYGPWARRGVLLALAALTLGYLHWRVTASLNLATPLSTGLSWLLLVAEAWLLLSGMLPLLLSWRRFDDGRAAADAAEAKWRDSSWRPRVDVLVPTCGEPLAVLERCLLGCSTLHYPHTTVWVLDDSDRPEVRALAERHGCRYLSRRERRHAKAGNLNAGLAASSGELVAVFDADFVPQAHFLERTIGLLADPNVGLVQTPQVFFNADPLMRNLAMERWMLPDEDNFYRWIEPVRSAWGAVVCAGTSFVARRQALDQVGGFVEAALSEDFVTGIALLGRGWQVRYLGDPLSAGLAAETLLDFVRQRQRWAAGTLQSLRLPQGPLRQGGLGMGQRLALLEGCLHWLNTLPRLLVLLMPLSYGLLGVVPISISAHGLLQRLLPLWLALLISVGWLNRRSRHALLNELPSWVLTVPLATTVLASLVGRFGGFRITPKQQPRSRGGSSWLLVTPLAVLLALQLINLARLAWALNPAGAGAALSGDPALQLALVWAGLTVLGLVVALRACYDCADPEPVPWLALPLAVQLHDAAGQRWCAVVEAISERGIDLLLSGDPPRENLQLQVSVDDAPIPALQAMLVDARSTGPKRSRLSLRWSDGQIPALQQLQRWLFCRPGCWLQRQAAGEWWALVQLLRQVMTLPRALKAGQRSLVRQADPGIPWTGGSAGR
jgi:cellulose synthase (UDP-forming)